MSVRSLLLPALLIVLAIGASAGISFGDDTTRHEVPMNAMFDTSPALTSTADATEANQCLAPVESQETADPASAYECPVGVDYCQRDSQCDAQCGGFFGACFQGCCRCAG